MITKIMNEERSPSFELVQNIMERFARQELSLDEAWELIYLQLSITIPARFPIDRFDTQQQITVG